MRNDVEFDADGVTLRGWLYIPDGAAGPVPTVVMSHGFSAVKEMYLDRFAEAGLGALVYDNRNFGASDGAAGPPTSRPCSSEIMGETMARGTT